MLPRGCGAAVIAPARRIGAWDSRRPIGRGFTPRRRHAPAGIIGLTPGSLDGRGGKVSIPKRSGTIASTMNRSKVLQALAGCKAELTARYGVTRLALFGSVARDSARTDSDVDILVAFDGPATSARYFGVLFFLEDLLERRVDLVTDKALRPELRPYVEREAVHV